MEKIQKAASEATIAKYFKNCHPYFTLRLLTAVDAGDDQVCLFLGVSSLIHSPLEPRSPGAVRHVPCLLDADSTESRRNYHSNERLATPGPPTPHSAGP